jgi:hypothetical protein
VESDVSSRAVPGTTASRLTRGLRGGAQVRTAWVRVIPIDGPSEDAIDVSTGDGETQLVATAEGIWVTNADSRTLARLDPDSLEITTIQRLGKSPGKSPVGLAVLGREVWVLSRNGWLWRADGASTLAGFQRLGRGSRALAATSDRLFALRGSGAVLEVDPAGGLPDLRVRTARGARHLAVSEKYLWVATHGGRQLVWADLESGGSSSLRAPGRVMALAADGTTCWAACWSTLRRRGELLELDADDGTISTRHRLNDKPRALFIDGNEVWLGEQTPAGLFGMPGGRVRRFVRGAASSGPREISTGWPPEHIWVSRDRLITTMRVWSSNNAGAGNGPA